MDQTVAQPAVTETIQANISGEINGQVAVGKYIVQIGSVHGGIVNINMADQKPRLRARQAPVYVLPRRFAGLLDRVSEVQGAAEALPAAQPVEFHARDGAGKSSLLRVLARHALATAFPDGVIYLPARNQTAGDLLQSIFDALFEYDAPYKPSEGEIRVALQKKRALIILDDIELSREDLESLLDAAPECGFLLASPDRKLWGVGLSVALPGLPLKEARSLLERELGRSLSEKESAAADELLSNLDGNPLAIIQVAALARERQDSVTSLAAATRDREPDKKVAAALLGLLNKEERRVVASMAALNGAPLNARHLPALTQIPEVEPLLGRLEKRGLVQTAGSGRYSLAGSFSLFLRETWDLGEWRHGLLEYFHAWAEARISEPQKILDDADAILRLIEWAGESGNWQGALDLVKAVESALALERRWGAWEQALQWSLQAAQALGNGHARAWALHQLGTRAMALGEDATARQALIQALRLREMLGDRAGAAVTRHNLNVLLGPPGGNGDSPPDVPLRPRASLYKVLAGTLTALVISGSILASVLRAEPPPVPVFTATVTSTTAVTEAEEEIPNTGGSPTDTPSPSATASLATATDTQLPTAYNSETPTDTPTLTATPCMVRRSWPVYTVRFGDTLWSIAQATDSSVLELRIANCLPSTDIYAGQSLFVPRPPVFPPTFTPTATPTLTPTLTPTHTETLTPSPTTPVPQFPDLVISSLEVGPPYGALQVIGPSPFTLSLRLTVANVGQAGSGPFQVAIYHRGLDLDNQPQPASISLLFEVEGLAPGASLNHTADLVFDDPSGWLAIEVWAVADDCTGLPHGGDCQVPESDENNNISAVRAVDLPRDEPPRVEIISPNTDVTLIYDGFEGEIWFKDLLLQGVAEDVEDGPLDGASLVWTTDQSALQPAQLGTGGEIQTTLFSDRCAGTTHVVTLTATDSQGALSQDQRTITLAPESCDPTILVESPSSGTYQPSGYEYAYDYPRFYLVLDGQAWAYDVLGRPIGERIVWETDQVDIQDASLGSGESVDIWLYLPDNPDTCDEIIHNVQVTVKDNEGFQARESIPITISECSVVDLELSQE